MTTGIYKLSFIGTTQVYIGQALDINRRFRTHTRLLQKGMGSKKLQEAYTSFGLPSVETLIECSRQELNKLEEEAIEIFDSVTNGFNTFSYYNGIHNTFGENSSNSNYTNNEYITAFLLLVDYNLTRVEVSEILDMSPAVVTTIDKCDNHCWLKDLYPDKYQILLDKKVRYSHTTNNTAQQRGIIYPKVRDPDGNLHEITSLRGFARKHNMHSSNLDQLVHGTIQSLHGWTLETTMLRQYPQVLSPGGEVFTIPYNGAATFAKAHNMTPGNLSMLLSGKKTKYKGWALLQNDDRTTS